MCERVGLCVKRDKQMGVQTAFMRGLPRPPSTRASALGPPFRSNLTFCIPLPSQIIHYFLVEITFYLTSVLMIRFPCGYGGKKDKVCVCVCEW